MATGMLQEMMMTTIGAEIARDMDGSAFRPFNLDGMRQSMRQFGYHPYGLVEMTHGESGQTVMAQIFVGFSLVMALKHQVEDKMQVSNVRARRDAASGQMMRGRKYGGGIRFGEMERDNVVGQSAPYTLRAIFCIMSDRTEIYFCYRCGVIATPQIQQIAGTEKGALKGICKACGNDTAFGRTDVTQIYVDIINSLAVANIRVFHKIVIERSAGSQLLQ
jgi:DNA-directed RNA polymerase beta subunit